jgi:hypothetical protein
MADDESEADEMDNELSEMSVAAAEAEAGLWQASKELVREVRDDPDRLTRIDPSEIDDAAFIADRLRDRPGDRVDLFDLVGDSVGYGVLDGTATGGRTRVLVPTSAIDVVGSAKTVTGDPVERPVFVPIESSGDPGSA